jgi:hypothetical protein
VADRACFGRREDTAGEVVGAGITLELGVGEHVPARDEYGMLHGDKCFSSDHGGRRYAGYLAERQVPFERDAASAPRAFFAYRFPGRVFVDFTRPADSLQPGAVPAHDARCAAVGNTIMRSASSEPVRPEPAPCHKDRHGGEHDVDDDA